MRGEGIEVRCGESVQGFEDGRVLVGNDAIAADLETRARSRAFL